MKARAFLSIDVALRTRSQLQSILREAKRLRLIAANKAYDLDGSVKAPRVTHRPALPLSRLPELLAMHRGLQRSAGHAPHSDAISVRFVRSSELRWTCLTTAAAHLERGFSAILLVTIGVTTTGASSNSAVDDGAAKQGVDCT